MTAIPCPGPLSTPGVPPARHARPRRAGPVRPARRPGRRGPVRPRHLGHPLLDVGRAQPARDLRPQARRPGRDTAARSGPIPTTVPGLDLCELFPLQAKLGDKIALVRSLHHTMSAHNDGSIEVLTGKTPAQPDPTSTALSEHPDFGMVASRVRGLRPDGLPRYVGIPRQPFMTRPTYLGVAPLGVRHRRPVGPELPPAEPDARRRRRRHAGSTTGAGCSRSSTASAASLDRPGGGGRRPVPGGGPPDAHQPQDRRRPSTCPGKTPGCATATAGTSGARAACWPGGWPRRAPRVITIDALAPSLSASATSVGTTTSTRRPAGTWATRCGTVPRSWTRRSRR